MLTKATYAMIEGAPANVLDFGAIGDWVTDDTAAFVLALAASDFVEIPASNTYIVSLVAVPSNKTITAYGAIVKATGTGNTGVYTIAAGSSNIKILGGSYRGPVYGGTPVPNPSYPASNGCIRILGTYNNVCSDITIQDAEIAGWNDYGIFAENVLRGQFNNNHIHTIGRDGVRTYGAVMTDVSHNHIHDITPGFSGVAPNLNAYGVTFTRNPTNEGTPLVNHPPTSYCTANNNLIEDIPTWKALDTHGGQNIVFANNVIRNCRFGFGIDEGDTSTLENAPPVNITVANNIVTLGSANAGAAGINISSTSAASRGTGVIVTGNTITGYGGSSTGAINVAYQDNLQIVNNTLINSAVCGINFASGTTTYGALLDGNVITNLTGSVLAAIAVQSATVEGFIKGGVFIQTTGSYTGVSLVSPSAGYGFRISDDLNYYGTITKWAANALSRIQSGGSVTQAKAYARVSGAGALRYGKNITSAAKDATGQYTIVITEEAITANALIPTATSNEAAAKIITCVAADTTTINVYAYDAAGAAVDSEFALVVHGV